MTMRRLEILRVEDTRPVDFATGKRLAVDPVEACDACGRGIVVLHHVSDGSVLGSECARWIRRPDTVRLCLPRFSGRQAEYYAARGIPIGR